MGNFNHLPEDITLDIVTRLPAESIMNCKSVCRSWRYLVSHHPSFHQLYLSHLNRSTDSGKLSFLISDWNRQLYYFEYNEKLDENEPVYCIRRINLTPPFASSYKVLGSSNGLVCLYGYGYPIPYCICNPFTREYVKLPKINRDCNDHCVHHSSGFGYVSSTNEYKVVQLFVLMRRGKPNFVMEVDVYTLGSGQGWRNVGGFDIQSGETYVQDGVFVNGALHWRDTVGGRVLVFNLAEEEFGEHLSPPPLSIHQRWNEVNYTTGELGGVLYHAINIVGDIRRDIWLLKEKNNNQDMEEQVEHGPLGWRNEFSLPGRIPLAFTKGGGVLCLNPIDDSSLGVYDTVTSTSKKLLDFTPYRQISPHKNTLVSLKELGEEEIKIMKSAVIEEQKAAL